MTPFTELVDLAGERVGGVALAASDDFFAAKENLLKPGRGVFIPDKYTDRGKWMDGWESRRRRGPGHDWCLIRLGLPGIIRGVNIDTNHFIGNHPESASLDACAAEREAPVERLQAASWTELVPITRLEGGSQNLVTVSDLRRFTHVRLHIYPDGGVARLRVHGDVAPDWSRIRAAGGLIDLASVELGGVVLLASDMYFGKKDHLILPGPPRDMGDGWETKRRRGPGHDWVMLRLGAEGLLARIEVDTTHFKGNYPERCSLEGARLPSLQTPEFMASQSVAWQDVLAPTKLEGNHRHVFERELEAKGPFTHVRLNIFPDGGVARLRVFGTLAGEP